MRLKRHPLRGPTQKGEDSRVVNFTISFLARLLADFVFHFLGR